MLAYSDNYFLFYIYWATAHSEMKRSEIELARRTLLAVIIVFFYFLML